MECRRCASSLARPGDFCLVCREPNADAVVLDVERDRTSVTMLHEDDVIGSTTVTTTPETGTEARAERRNYAGRITDEIHRKRPEAVYATGHRSILTAIGRQVTAPFYRVDGENPVQTVLDRRDNRALDVVDRPPGEKIGGSHSTLIGGRDGKRVIRTVAEHPNVKKIVPGPIDGGGMGSQSGLRAKVTRADDGGNLRLLIRNGSSVQENRIVTTARDRRDGERLRADLNEALEAGDLAG